MKDAYFIITNNPQHAKQTLRNNDYELMWAQVTDVTNYHINLFVPIFFLLKPSRNINSIIMNLDLLSKPILSHYYSTLLYKCPKHYFLNMSNVKDQKSFSSSKVYSNFSAKYLIVLSCVEIDKPIPLVSQLHRRVMIKPKIDDNHIRIRHYDII